MLLPFAMHWVQKNGGIGAVQLTPDGQLQPQDADAVLQDSIPELEQELDRARRETV